MKVLKTYLCLPVFIMTSVLVVGQERLDKVHLNIEASGLAIQGYDPASYFDVEGPVKGRKDITHNRGGVVYRFANQENLAKFKSDPGKYEPAYGGWCAYAMGAAGEKVEVDPKTFKVIGGRNYLFYNFYFTNTLKKWNVDESNLKPAADQHWAELTQ